MSGFRLLAFLTGNQVNPLLQPIFAFTRVPMPPVSKFFQIGGRNKRHFQVLKYIELWCEDDTAERTGAENFGTDGGRNSDNYTLCFRNLIQRQAEPIEGCNLARDFVSCVGDKLVSVGP